MTPPPRAELLELYHTCLRTNGRLLLEGVAARAGCATANGRVYGASDLKRVAKRYARAVVARGLALGELDHPSYATPFYRRVSLANASHVVLSLQWRGRLTGRRRRRPESGGGELWAVVEVLPTPSGLLLWELAARGVPLAISQRCWAEVEWCCVVSRGGDERGGSSGTTATTTTTTAAMMQQRVCGSTLELLAFDAVPDPANVGAWMRPVAARYGPNTGAAAATAAVVALAHLGLGSVLVQEAAATAAQGGEGLPHAGLVLGAVEAAAAAGRPLPRRVGALHLTESHYDVFGGEAEKEEHEKEAQLAAIVASAAARLGGGSGNSSGPVRALPAHWRRFAERALACEARERERQTRLEVVVAVEEDEVGCWGWWWWRGWRGQQRPRRRPRGLGGSSAAESAAAVHPLCHHPERLPTPPPPEAADAATRALEVDAVLWERAAKARDVRRRALLPLVWRCSSSSSSSSSPPSDAA
jgi:hypothetical protein